MFLVLSILPNYFTYYVFKTEFHLKISGMIHDHILRKDNKGSKYKPYKCSISITIYFKYKLYNIL